MENLYELLQLTEECFEFIDDSCPNNLIEQLLISIIYYLKHSLYLLKSNNIPILNEQSTTKAKNEAQYFALFENCLQILKFVNSICSKNSEMIINMLNINIMDNNELNIKIDGLNDQMNNSQFYMKLKKLIDLFPQIITELGINLFLQIPNINNISRIKLSISLSYKYIKLISDITVNNLEKINEIRKQNHSNKEEFVFNYTINSHDKLNESMRHNDLNNKNINFEDPEGVILNSTSSSCSSYIDGNFDLDWRASSKNSIMDDPKVNDIVKYYLKINYGELQRIQVNIPL